MIEPVTRTTVGLRSTEWSKRRGLSLCAAHGGGVGRLGFRTGASIGRGARASLPRMLLTPDGPRRQGESKTLCQDKKIYHAQTLRKSDRRCLKKQTDGVWKRGRCGRVGGGARPGEQSICRRPAGTIFSSAVLVCALLPLVDERSRPSCHGRRGCRRADCSRGSAPEGSGPDRQLRGAALRRILGPTGDGGQPKVPRSRLRASPHGRVSGGVDAHLGGEDTGEQLEFDVRR